MTNELYHHGILGQKWGVRRYQNPDGTRTAAGKKRYSSDSQSSIEGKRGLTDAQKKALKIAGIAAASALAAYGAYKIGSPIIKNVTTSRAENIARSMIDDKIGLLKIDIKDSEEKLDYVTKALTNERENILKTAQGFNDRDLELKNQIKELTEAVKRGAVDKKWATERGIALSKDLSNNQAIAKGFWEDVVKRGWDINVLNRPDVSRDILTEQIQRGQRSIDTLTKNTDSLVSSFVKDAVSDNVITNIKRLLNDFDDVPFKKLKTAV